MSLGWAGEGCWRWDGGCNLIHGHNCECGFGFGFGFEFEFELGEEQAELEVVALGRRGRDMDSGIRGFQR